MGLFNRDTRRSRVNGLYDPFFLMGFLFHPEVFILFSVRFFLFVCGRKLLITVHRNFSTVSFVG